jgi:hypothetical protein
VQDAPVLDSAPDTMPPVDERLSVIAFCGAGGTVGGSYYGELCFGAADLATAPAQNEQFIWQPGPMRLITP